MNATIELLKVKSGFVFKTDIKKIEESDVFEILGNEFPIMNEALEGRTSQTTIYKTMNCFSDYTKHLINKGNFREVKHCFKVADKIVKNGNLVVKNAITNCYLNSLAVILDFSGPLSNKVKSLLSETLRLEYTRKVNARGI